MTDDPRLEPDPVVPARPVTPYAHLEPVDPLDPDPDAPVLDVTAELRGVVERIARAGVGCCADDTWRGRLCQYHDGMLDGMLLLADALEALERGEDPTP